MSVPELYVACDIKRRSTRAEVKSFRSKLFELVREAQPCSVRHAYYLAVTHGLVGKDAGGKRGNYTKVMRAIGDMREAGDLPFRWIVDNTRLRRGPSLWRNSTDALEYWARAYRRDLWQRQDHYLEVWCESDSIAGVIARVTEDLGIDIMPMRGQSSKTFAWAAAQSWNGDMRTIVVLYIGDYDPAGLVIADSLEERLARYAKDVSIGDLKFVRLAVSARQVRELGLVGHALNPKAPGVSEFRSLCAQHGLAYEAVEAEAVEPNRMRELVREAIESYIDPWSWKQQRAVEAAERESLAALAGGLAL